MEADRQKAELEKKANDDIQKAKAQQLVKMDIDEDTGQREEQQRTVHRLSDIETSGVGDKSETFPELDEVIGSSDSESNDKSAAKARDLQVRFINL